MKKAFIFFLCLSWQISYAQLNDSKTTLVDGFADYSAFSDSVIVAIENYLAEFRATHPDRIVIVPADTTISNGDTTITEPDTILIKGLQIRLADDVEIPKTVLWPTGTVAEWDEVWWLGDTLVETVEVFATRLDTAENRIGLRYELHVPSGKYRWFVGGVQQPGFVDDPLEHMKQLPGKIKHKDSAGRKKRKKEKKPKK